MTDGASVSSPVRSRRPRFGGGALALLAVAAVGCAPAPGQRLAGWVVRTSADDPGVAVQLPARLDRTLIPPQVRQFSLSAEVTLPAGSRGAALELIVPDGAAVPRLSVDGAPAQAPARVAIMAYRSRGPYVWPIPPSATSRRCLVAAPRLRQQLDPERLVHHRAATGPGRQQRRQRPPGSPSST